MLDIAGGNTQEAARVGPVALNGTILAGTLVVKTEEDWNELRRDQGRLSDLLNLVGLPPEDGLASVNSEKL